MNSYVETRKLVIKKPSIWESVLTFFRRKNFFDRRKDARFEIHPPFACEIIYMLEGQERRMASQIMDISKGGALVFTDKEKIYPATKVRIAFRAHSSNDMLSADCEIVRTYRLHTEQWHYSGVKFLDQNQKSLPVLLDLVLGSG